MAGAAPGRFNLAKACLARNARLRPDATALVVVADAGAPIETAERWTYRELDLAVRRVAAGLLARGLHPGDRVLIRLPNTSDYALLFFGAAAAGLVPVPVSPQLTDAEAELLQEDSGASAVAHLGPAVSSGAALHLDAEAIAALCGTEPLPGYAATASEDSAYLIYTSGTSGRPKGVVHAHRVLLGRRPIHRDWEAIGAGDVMLHAGAFNWSYTLGVGLFDPWYNGATAVLYTGPKDVAVWPRLIVAAGATIFAAVPSLYRQMLKYCALEPGAFPTLRHALAAGEALAPDLLREWQARTGVPLYEAIGMTECSTFASSGPAVPARPGSAGRPQTGRSIAILPVAGGTTPLPPGEIGLLAISRRDPGLMLGYWQRPEEDAATARGDWFVGGDLASIDREGYLTHHGRADDVMNAGGFRVSPLEVENALADCPGVAEVAVREHRLRPDLSIVAAFVVRTPGSAIPAEAVLAHAESRLAPYKRPREVIFVESLPRSANGKLNRRALG